jgi:hypothetical protein
VGREGNWAFTPVAPSASLGDLLSRASPSPPVHRGGAQPAEGDNCVEDALLEISALNCRTQRFVLDMAKVQLGHDIVTSIPDCNGCAGELKRPSFCGRPLPSNVSLVLLHHVYPAGSSKKAQVPVSYRSLLKILSR